MYKYILVFVMLFFGRLVAFGQPVEMATRLRAEGKIYFVVAVMLVIFLGVAAYLFSLDKRVKKLERDVD